MYVCMYVCMYVRTYVRMYVRMYVCMYVCIYICTYIHIILVCILRRLSVLYVQLLQEFIGVWRWTIYQGWGVYSSDNNTDSTGKVSKPSAIQHQIMTKVCMHNVIQI